MIKSIYSWGSRMLTMTRRSRNARNGGKRSLTSVSFYGLLGAGNIGNDASFETVYEWIRHDLPDCHLTAITTHPKEFFETYGIESRALSVNVAHPRLGRRTLGRVVGRFGDLPRSLKLAGETDAILVAGMGILEDSPRVSPAGIPLLLLLAALSCRVRGKKFMLLDIGGDVSPNVLTRQLFKATAGLATHVSYRDHRSALAIEGAAGDCGGEVTVLPDLAFAHPQRLLSGTTGEGVVIGLMKIGTADQQEAYLETTVALIRALRDDSHPVTLVGGDVSDYEMVERVLERLDNASCGRARVSKVTIERYAELLRVLVGARVVIASRYHNLVAAVSLGKPTISLGYATKCDDLLNTVGLGAFTHDIFNYDPSLVRNQVGEVCSRQREITTFMRSCTEDYAQQVKAHLAVVLPRSGAEVSGAVAVTGPRPRHARPTDGPKFATSS